MSERMRRWMSVLLVVGSLFLVQASCDDETENIVLQATDSCRDTQCRDDCQGGTACEIKCCKAEK